MRCTLFRSLCAATLLAFASQASAAVIISEIMYNPGSSESLPGYAEWIEIYNTGPGAVDIGGWTIQDEDGTSSTAIPAASSIAEGEAIVLFDDDTTVSEFQAAWGTGFQLFALDFNSLSGLSNSPSATSEILELIDDSAVSVDIANYDDTSPWPSEGTHSIYLLATALDSVSNDDGSNWAASVAGVAGAYNAVGVGNFDSSDIGSPGVVIPEPGSVVLVLLGMIAAAVVRMRRTLG